MIVIIFVYFARFREQVTFLLLALDQQNDDDALQKVDTLAGTSGDTRRSMGNSSTW